MRGGARLRFGRSVSRLSSWSVVAALVLAAGLWAVAQVLKWPVPVRAVLAATAATAAAVAPELRGRVARRTLREQLLGRVEVPRRELPLVREVEMGEVRVHAAQVSVPFIARDAVDEFDEALTSGTPVVLIGHSMSGKTRLAFERIKALYPDAPLLAPLPGKALRELLDAGLRVDGMVVWLDDLDRYLVGQDALDIGNLARLVGGKAIVVATMRRAAFNSFRPRRDAVPAGWEVLDRFRKVSLERLLTRRERERVVNRPGIHGGSIPWK